MILLCDDFPEEVTVNGRGYRIYTDFRDWIRFCIMLLDDSLEQDDKLIAALQWYESELPESIPDAIEALRLFMVHSFSSGDKENDRSDSTKPLISYTVDAPFILSDFLCYYSINLKTIDYMHWWHFRALLIGLPEDSSIKKRISYRAVDLSEIENDKERDRIRKIKQSIALPSICEDIDIAAAFE